MSSKNLKYSTKIPPQNSEKRPRPDSGKSSDHLVNSTKKAIIQQALHLFSERGYDGTTTREIAKAAGVNHALIQHHFGGKAGLWRSAAALLFNRSDEEMNAYFEEVKDIVDPVEKLRCCIRHYVNYCAAYPEHARIMVQESTGENDRISWAVEHHTDRTHWLESLFEELFAVGALPRMSIISLRYIFTAACQHIFTLAAEARLVFGVDVAHKAQVEAHIAAVEKLFIRDSGDDS